MVQVKEKLNKKPVYCRQCRSRDTWKRDPQRDVYSESGGLLWKAWVCTTCGSKTLRPAKDGKNLPGTYQEGH